MVKPVGQADFCNDGGYRVDFAPLTPLVQPSGRCIVNHSRFFIKTWVLLRKTRIFTNILHSHLLICKENPDLVPDRPAPRCTQLP